VLSDRERRVLDRIEQELRRSDPDLVRKFTRMRARRVSGASMLLTFGLVLLVLGSAIVSVPVAVLGMVIAAIALVGAYYRRPMGFGLPGRA
jgi:Flp pilus assembly protein TadB